ncbi:hypothetical protein LO763_24095 [Glycomyces sp. A-F 0318]|uniref:hypothetical protein n=1 Tax=Glycomyces amatae TaxID=2881355 RepID=UPI001E526AB2|nr:hypothetical protein [Glycomyces amatae]MCD0446704.1 hypothetical protein [Glycomyces amatae]
MVAPTQFPGPKHAEMVKDYLAVFEDILTVRWKRQAALDFRGNRHIVNRLSATDVKSCVLVWPRLSDPDVFYHRGFCDYGFWAEGDADKAPPSTCSGRLPPNMAGVEVTDKRTGRTAPLPAQVQCPMPQVMEQVPQWAKAECSALYRRIPLFDHQKQEELGAGYAALQAISTALYAGDSDDGGKGSKGAGDLSALIEDLPSDASVFDEWWEAWTGLAADALRHGFMVSPKPTRRSHYDLATSLAMRVHLRAGIIEFGRNNVIGAIEGATRALYATSTTTSEGTAGWKTMQGVGDFLALVGGPKGAAAGGAISLIGFLGEQMFPVPVKQVDFSGDFKKIVVDLGAKIDEVRTEVESKEGEYAAAVSELRDRINGKSGFELELYDLTENHASGDDARKSEKFSVSVDMVMSLAEQCGKIAIGYEGLLAHFKGAYKAEGQLADKDGIARPADVDVMALNREFEQYMRTATARYYLARDQIREAAEDYDEADGNAAQDFERIMGDPDMRKTMDKTSELDLEAEAADTQRPAGADTDPYEDGTYVTRKSQEAAAS